MNTCIKFGTQLYGKQIVSILMGTNCVPIVADLFLFCYKRNCMMSLSGDNESVIIEAFDSMSR